MNELNTRIKSGVKCFRRLLDSLYWSDSNLPFTMCKVFRNSSHPEIKKLFYYDYKHRLLIFEDFHLQKKDLDYFLKINEKIIILVNMSNFTYFFHLLKLIN